NAFGYLIPCDHTGGDDVPDLPFVNWVVTGISAADGYCQPAPGHEFDASDPCIGGGHVEASKFQYIDGRFNPTEPQFRGFRLVRRYSLETNTTETTFGQDTQDKGKVINIDHFAGVEGIYGVRVQRSTISGVSLH